MTAPTLPALRNDTVIVRLEAARAALSEAKTIQQSKAIADVAAAAEIYARRQKLGEEAIDFAHSVKIEALRLLGEILKDTPKSEGRKLNGRDSFGGTRQEPPKNEARTLAEMGVDKKTSSMAQKLAALPAKAFEEVREGHKSIGQAIAKVDGARKEPSKADPRDAEIKRLTAALEEANEAKNDLADIAREQEDKLTALETTDPDEQQKEIQKLQKRIVRLEAEIERLTIARNDCQNKNNELIRQVKILQRKPGGR